MAVDEDVVMRKKTNKQKFNQRKISLYHEFLLTIWAKIYTKHFNLQYQKTGSFSAFTHTDAVNEYYLLFFMITSKQTDSFIEATELVEWINTHNNGVLPDNLQQLFNEFLLERI